MDKKQSRIELLETAPVAKSIIKLALPMMLSMLAQMIYNLTDTFFIGQTGNPNMVAGISLAMPLFMISQGVGNIFSIGASSYISRLLGAKRGGDAKKTSAVSFYTTLVIGLVITLLLVLFKAPILRIIGTSDVTFVYANSYFSIIAVLIVFPVVSIALSGQIRSEGATTQAMQGMLIGIVINIILDPIFILGFKRGVAGAAWATNIGTMASVIYYTIHLLSKNTMLSISIKDFKPSRIIYFEVLKIGVPSALTNIAMTFAMVISNIIIAGYGDFAIAGSGVNMRVVSMSFMLILALAMGYQPFAGYNYGAKNYKRLREGLKITLIYTTALSLFFLAVFLLFGEALIRLFINDAQTVTAGTKMLHAFVWGLPFMGLQITVMVTFQATGKALMSTIINLGRQFLFYLPLLFILNHYFHFEGFMYAQPAADILTSVIAIILSIDMLKKLNAEGGKQNG
jgi:putative MATE family efflux protein